MLNNEICMSNGSYLAMLYSNSGRLDPIPSDPTDLQHVQMTPARARGRPPGSRLHSHNGSGASSQPIPDHIQESPKHPHRCQHCIKAFSSAHLLNQHMLVHSGLRKHKCDFCDRAFKQSSHLKQHQRTHTGETPYKCHVEGCGRAFAQLANLQQHTRNHENVKEAADRKPHQCRVCARRFATEKSLWKHVTKAHAHLGHMHGNST